MNVLTLPGVQAGLKFLRETPGPGVPVCALSFLRPEKFEVGLLRRNLRHD
jgi:hypothetical protein